MPRRIVIHAGFHKTGTSSVQQTLRINRPHLKPYLRSVLKGAMGDLVHAARGFSTWRDPMTLAKFCHRFEALLLGNADMPRRTLCLSAEELAGHLPGRGPLADYSAAPILAGEMARLVAQVFPGTELVFFYSTRAPGIWLRSAYWEHVKSSSLTMGWEEFDKTYAGAADLDRIVANIAAAVPHKVHATRLEDSAGQPAGPASPVLDLCGVPAGIWPSLTLAAPANEKRSQTVLLALLAANRDYPDKEVRDAAKKAILRAAQEG